MSQAKKIVKTCRCGKKGCVEACTGKIAIMRDARQAALERRWVSLRVWLWRRQE